MKNKKAYIFTAVIVAVLLCAGFIHGKYVVPIVMYHSINPDFSVSSDKLNVTPPTFERQMKFLYKHRYNVIPLEQLYLLIEQKQKIPPKTIAITVDDGHKDNYTYLFPILKRYNLPATIFIIVNEVGRAQGDRLNWNDIKTMQDSGLITFGSHTMDHVPLVNIKSDEKLKEEIFESKRILEQKLDRPVNIFSYPEGRFNAKVRKFVIAAGYKMAVATNPGMDYPNDDIFALKRLRISENSRNMFVFYVETSGYYNFMREYRQKRKYCSFSK